MKPSAEEGMEMGTIKTTTVDEVKLKEDQAMAKWRVGPTGLISCRDANLVEMGDGAAHSACTAAACPTSIPSQADKHL
jgi:hypothetical protein